MCITPSQPLYTLPLRWFTALLMGMALLTSTASQAALVAHYPMESTTVTDVTGQNPTPGNNIGATSVLGRVGNGLYFNGTSAYVDLGAVNVLANSQRASITAWANWDNAATITGGGDTILSWWNSTQGILFQTNITAEGVLAVVGGGTTYGSSTSSVDINGWHHWAMVFDGALTGNANRLKVYVDGQPVALTFYNNNPIPANVPNISTNMNIGRLSGTSSRYWQGIIDEVKIYNNALTQTEVNNEIAAAGGTPTTYTLSVTKAGTGSGTVTSNVGGINCGTTCTSSALASGTPVTLTATPASGSTFTGWTGGTGCTTAGVCTLSASTTITATFTTIPPSTYTLTVAKAGTGSGTVTSNVGGINCVATCTTATTTALTSGTMVTLTATPASGSTFTGWSGGTGCTTAGVCTLSASTTITATFNISTGGTQNWQPSGIDLIYTYNGGNIGIGMTCPAGQPTSSLCVAGNIAAKYQDVAEWVPATRLLPIGTVVILDSDHSNHVMASFKSYDTRVAGVITDMPGIILGEEGTGKVKVATTGRVKVKVDATKGAIAVGDLLVTSEREGIAMRSQPLDLGGTPIHRPGTLIGKALEPLSDGEGEILVLLSLQ